MVIEGNEDLNEGSLRPEAATMSVLIVDDHALLADAVTIALRVKGFVAHTVEPSSVAFVVDRALELEPTVALVDLDLGSATMCGLDLIGPLVDAGVRVVVFSSWNDRLVSAASLEAGAVGVVNKSANFTEVLAALQAAVGGDPQHKPAMLDELERELRQRRTAHAKELTPFGLLTTREKHVLASLIDGRSATTIASTSFVSIATVRSQIRAVLQKLDVCSQLEAVAAANRCGWSSAGFTPVMRYSSTFALAGPDRRSAQRLDDVSTAGCGMRFVP